MRDYALKKYKKHAKMQKSVSKISFFRFFRVFMLKELKIMACLNPRKIRNQSKTYREGTDPVYILVPCGQCEECRKAKQKEWAHRAYEQMQSTIKAGGFVLFPTLTYAPAHLPYFDYKDETHDYHIPCFSKKHYDKFYNSLRKHYERKGIYGIKCLHCCEYGEKRHRPHYHDLIFFPAGVTETDAVKQVQKYWPYGYVRYSDLGRTVSSLEACMYCSKYVCKDLNYYNRADLKSFMAAYAYNDEAQKAIKPYLPTHLQSKGFGIGLYEKLLEMPQDKLYTALRDGIRMPLTETRLRIPRYIWQKLMYVEKDGFRVPTQLNKDFQIWNYEYDVERIATDLKESTSVEGLRQYIENDEDISKKFPEFAMMGLNSTLKIHNYLEEMRQGIDFNDLAVYKKVFHGYSVLTDDVLELIGLPTDIDVFDHAKQIFAARLTLDRDRKYFNDEGYLSDNLIYEDELENLYDALPVMAPFVKYLDLVDFIKRFGYRKRNKAEVKKDKIIKKLREMFKEK